MLLDANARLSDWSMKDFWVAHQVCFLNVHLELVFIL